jgi:ribosome maturation factor RimP
MSLALAEHLDTQDLIAGNYVLEISSPGIARELSSDRDFTSFKGFAIIVTTSTLDQNKTEWRGRLQGRDADTLHLNQKGKVITIPRSSIIKVELENNS